MYKIILIIVFNIKKHTHTHTKNSKINVGVLLCCVCFAQHCKYRNYKSFVWEHRKKLLATFFSQFSKCSSPSELYYFRISRNIKRRKMSEIVLAFFQDFFLSLTSRGWILRRRFIPWNWERIVLHRSTIIRLACSLQLQIQKVSN